MTVNVPVCRVAIVLSDFNYTRIFFRQSFEKETRNVTLNENSSSGGRVVSCVWTDGQTDVTKIIVAFRNFFIYLLTAIGLSPGGRSTVHIYTQTIHRTIQNKQYIEKRNNFGRVRAVPRLV